MAELNQLRERAAEAQRENENLREERDRVQDDWSKTRARATELETEINTLREQLKTAWDGESRVKSVEDELTAANARIAELEAKLGEASDEANALRSEGDQRIAAVEAERDAVRGELEETRARHDAAAQEAASLLQRAEGLVELVEANRARFRQVEETQREQIDALEKLIEERAAQSVHKEEFDKVQQEANEIRSRAEQAERERDEARNVLDTAQTERDEANNAAQSLRSELDEFRSAHDAAISDAKREADGIAEERDRIAVELSTLTTTNNTLEARLAESDSARRAVESELEETKKAFETAQAEAAGNLAAANARTGDLEDRLSAAEDALSMLRGVVQGFAGDLASFANEMRSGAQELDDMAGRLTQGERTTDPEAGEVAEAAMIEAVDDSDAIVISDSDPIVIPDAPTPAAPMSQPEQEEDVTIDSESDESPVDLDPLDAIVEQFSAEAENETESIAEFPESNETNQPAPLQDETFDNPSNGHHDENGTQSNGHLKHDGYGLPTHELELPNWNGPVESQPAQDAGDDEETIPTHDIDNTGL